MNIKFIDSHSNTAAVNMAIDEYFLYNSLTPILRFYSWNPSAISLGYFQDLSDINLEVCRKNAIDIVRRITGGKSVFHDKELTYSFIVDQKDMPLNLLDSYKKISLAILFALKSFGIDAQMQEREQKEKSAICFHGINYNEIVVGNKKIVGSAQTRKNGKILQHGSILLDIDYEKMISLFHTPNKEKSVEKSKQRVTAIKRELGKNIDKETLKAKLLQGFTRSLGANIQEENIKEEEYKNIEKISEEKYKQASWLCKKNSNEHTRHDQDRILLS